MASNHLSFILVLFAWLSVVNGSEWYVDSSATSSSESGSPTNPCISISKCVSDVAANGDTIYVKPGNGYTGISNTGICAISTKCNSTGLSLIGLGDPSEIIWHAQDPTKYSESRALVIDGGVFVRVSNFTITGFKFTVPSALYSDLRYAGGAVQVKNSSVIFNHMIFNNNNATQGGGIGASSSNVTVSNSVFNSNTALLAGGAISLDSSTFIGNNVEFHLNKAVGYSASHSGKLGQGGALYVVGNSQNTFLFDTVYFRNNTAGEGGGAIHIQSVSVRQDALLIKNCIFAYNRASSGTACVSASSCNVRGGAIYSSVPMVNIKDTQFMDNSAYTNVVNQYAAGGAIYLTDVYGSNVVTYLNVEISESSFTDNSASGYGGAIYSLNQVLYLDDVHFTNNYAGVSSILFSDYANSGGAIWFSNTNTIGVSRILHSTFTNNFILSGWGGAVFISDSPEGIFIYDVRFLGNSALSSYTYVGQGGAIMTSHDTILEVSNCHFQNNTALPRTDAQNKPYTLSGAGGAVYIQSANVTLTNNTFTQNIVVSGQFDAGSLGGAILLEDATESLIRECTFTNNGASGFFEYSTYASSGSGGAIALKFSAATISDCSFNENWVSAGGSYFSEGGAMAVYFDYTGNNGEGVLIQDSVFYKNAAFGQMCYSYTGTSNAGQGGAVAIVGAADPGVHMNNVSFEYNSAVSRTGILELSYGGALVVSLAANITAHELSMKRNVALFGLGNDMCRLNGKTGAINNISISNGHFSSASILDIASIEVYLQARESGLCHFMDLIMDHDVAYGGSKLHGRRDLEHESRALKEWEMKRETGNDRILMARHERHLDLQEQRRLLKTQSEEEGRQLGGVALQSHYHYPSLLITDGELTMTNTEFAGDYHVFLGNYQNLQLVNVPNKHRCHVYIQGQIPPDTFALTAYEATVTLQDSANATSHLDRLILLNSTLSIANDIVVSGNSSVIGSTISRANGSEAFIINSDDLAEFPSIEFQLNVVTGVNDADLRIIDDISPTTVKLAHFPAVLYLNGVRLVIQKFAHFEAPRSSSTSSNDNYYLKLQEERLSLDIETKMRHTLFIHLCDNAIIHINSNATLALLSHVYIEADTPTSSAIMNTGIINLLGGRNLLADRESNNIPVINDDAIRPSHTTHTSLTSSLTVRGEFNQTETGCVVVTLNSTGQDEAVLNLVSNSSFLGHLRVLLPEKPDISFYNADPVSSWTVATYLTLARHPSDKRVKLYAPLGLAFAEELVRMHNETDFVSIADNVHAISEYSRAQADPGSYSVALASASTPAPPSTRSSTYKDVLRDNNTVTDTYVDRYTIQSMSCEDVIPYSAHTGGATGAYACFLCLSNSSCSYCNNGGCMGVGAECPGDADGVKFQGTCCQENCNGHGTCEALDGYTQFVCKCSPFYAGDSCRSLSNVSIVTITLAGAAVVVIFILFYNYRIAQGKKSQVLEELRQGLLYGQDSNDGTQNLDSINEAYIQSLQQGLILKDASVKFEEIKIEKQVGEGSFGIVYKATFRGASVAVKKMRPVFVELTASDIEGFNKEAYMMSRLKHPNIVLVMGISFVEQEVLPPPSSRRRLKSLGARPNEEEEEEMLLRSANNKNLPKTVCIVTEYLEQGSLADILYGPKKLPADVWTYDLILTCALQAARGMLYLHSHSPPICHRDLKSSNLVVDDHWVVKVTDFGMSRIIPERVIDVEKGVDQSKDPESVGLKGGGLGSSSGGATPGIGTTSTHTGLTPEGSEPPSVENSGQSVFDISASMRVLEKSKGASLEMTSNLGTTAWCAPELLTASSTTKYSVKVDVYSFGLVLWELWEKRRPFDHYTSRFDIIDAIRSGERPTLSDNCPPAFRSLITRCWQEEPARRPMFQYIVRYLKDELARVKRARDTRRQKSTNTAPATNFLSNMWGADQPSNATELPITTRESIEGVGMSTLESKRDDSRFPLYADPDINYLAASPAVHTPMFADLMSQHQHHNRVDTLSQQVDNPIHGTSTSTSNAGGVSPSNAPKGGWRDKYVMRMSGWQPSQPDTGLPPSSGGNSASTTPKGTSFLPGFFNDQVEANEAIPSNPYRPVDLEKIPPRKQSRVNSLLEEEEEESEDDNDSGEFFKSDI